MQRIDTILEKLAELNRLKEKATSIDVDLMMDYTRVVYADLQEWKKRIEFTENIPTATSTIVVSTPQVDNVPKEVSPKKAANLEALVGINDKYLFTNELFSNNNTEYSNTLNTLNDFDNYEQAVNWLNSKYHWEDDNHAAITLMELLKSYYSNK